MAIQEKPTRIEFSYIDKDNKKIEMVYEETQYEKHIIIYDEDGSIRNKLPLSFFEEVFQFLCEKKIIKNNKNNKKIVFPNIKKKEDNNNNNNNKPFGSLQKQKQEVKKTDKKTKYNVEKTDDKTFVIKGNNIKNNFRTAGGHQPQRYNKNIDNDNLSKGRTGENKSNNEEKTI